MTFSSRPTLLISGLLWLGVTLYGIYFLFTLFTASKREDQPINFGIDLVGGTYLTLEVKVNEAVKNELMSVMQNLSDQLKKDNTALPGVPTVNEAAGMGILVFNSEQEAAQARKIYSNPEVTITQDGKNLNFTLTAAQLDHIRREAVDTDIAVLRTRLDAYGAGEVTIVPQGDKHIVVELPNVSDPEQAKARIGSAAILEIKPVYDRAHTKQELLERYSNNLPEGTMIVEGKKHKGETTEYYLVSSYAKITGKSLKDSRYQSNRDSFTHGTPHAVGLEFNSDGNSKFYELTKSQIGNQIAITLDNVVVTAPRVNCALDGREGIIITGFNSEEDSNELVAMLKSGAFSAPVEVVEERHIGPSLGQESIRKGLMSCAIGLGLLLLFSILVYKTAGLLAFIVLIYNLLFILFGLALIPDATLTLPGIAGMVLTVGMAIDSSILIYERIKEELAAGVPLRKAIDAGFGGAMGVIIDANITTFIVGAVLYYMGSPAIQGFALTMMIGIVATLITGLVFLKWLFNAILALGVQKIKI